MNVSNHACPHEDSIESCLFSVRGHAYSTRKRAVHLIVTMFKMAPYSDVVSTLDDYGCSNERLDETHEGFLVSRDFVLHRWPGACGAGCGVQRCALLLSSAAELLHSTYDMSLKNGFGPGYCATFVANVTNKMFVYIA